MTDIAYWLTHALSHKCVTVLRKMSEDRHPWTADRFTEAYLIQEGCIEPVYDSRTYRVTEKGLDALRFYAPEDTCTTQE